MSARRNWARENAACALVVFGTMAAVLLLDSGSVRAENTNGNADDTRSVPRSSSHQERTILDALFAWLTSPACEVTSTTACTDAVVPVRAKVSVRPSSPCPSSQTAPQVATARPFWARCTTPSGGPQHAIWIPVFATGLKPSLQLLHWGAPHRETAASVPWRDG